MFSSRLNHFKKISLVSSPTPTLTRTPTPTPTRAGSFTPVAFVVTTGTSRSVPTGATSMKAWVIGGGGGGSFDDGGCGGGTDGGYGGEAVKTYSVTGGNSVTYAIGSGGTGGSASALSTNGGNSTVTYGGVTITGQGGNSGDNSGNSGSGVGGDFNRTFYAGGVLDYQGRAAAVTLSGSSLNAGFKGITSNPGTNGSPGGIVLYFT